MANVLFEKPSMRFTWDKLGDIEAGRGELGCEMPVLLYRLFAYSMYDVLDQRFAKETVNDIIREAGYIAGKEFAANALNLKLEPAAFLIHLRHKFEELKIGILRIERFDMKDYSFTLTVSGDLDCSGLPPSGDVVCHYDEGLLAGIMEVYSGQMFEVIEIDCWAIGHRVCRFTGKPVAKEVYAAI